MEPEGSLPHSQQAAACSYPEPDQSSPCPHIALIENQFYYYYTIWMSLVTGISSRYFSWTSGDPQPLTLQASHCSTFRITCDVPSIAAFYSESIKCFPGTVSKFFLKLPVTIPVAPIITGTNVHFRLHIRCISIQKLLLLLLLLFRLHDVCSIIRVA